jgi:SAM-dependent methyltransferase
MNKNYSIIRICEYEKLQNTPAQGLVLDIGGSTKSGYHSLLKDAEKITTVNIDPSYGCDLVFDIQKPFPLESNSFDTVVSMNVLEHIFDFHPVFSEVHRVLKPGGTFVSSTPFMFHVHGSPDDYFRYTESALRGLAAKHGFRVERIEVLGYGVFSLLWQTVGGVIPTTVLRYIGKNVAILLDKTLLHFRPFQKLRNRIPLGYFWVMKK